MGRTPLLLVSLMPALLAASNRVVHSQFMAVRSGSGVAHSNCNEICASNHNYSLNSMCVTDCETEMYKCHGGVRVPGSAEVVTPEDVCEHQVLVKYGKAGFELKVKEKDYKLGEYGEKNEEGNYGERLHDHIHDTWRETAGPRHDVDHHYGDRLHENVRDAPLHAQEDAHDDIEKHFERRHPDKGNYDERLSDAVVDAPRNTAESLEHHTGKTAESLEHGAAGTAESVEDARAAAVAPAAEAADKVEHETAKTAESVEHGAAKTSEGVDKAAESLQHETAKAAENVEHETAKTAEKVEKDMEKRN